MWVCARETYGGEPDTRKEQYYTDGDTLINEILYHKLILYQIETGLAPGANPVRYFGYYGAIRNKDNMQVEIIFKDFEQPEIIYDFNLSSGDTIKSGYGGSEDWWFEVRGPLIITTIDSIEICGKYHKQYHLNDTGEYPHRLIEGIGYTQGLIQPFFFTFEERSYTICYSEINNSTCELLVINELYGWPVLDNCDLLLSDKLLYANNNIKIFPNPSSGFISIKSDKRILEYSIINKLGQKICYRNNLYDTDVKIRTHLSNGIYFLRIKSENQGISVNKIIIQK